MKAIGPTNFIAPLFELVGSQFDSRIIQQSYLEFIAGNSRKQHLNLVVMAAPISARCITLSKGKMDEDATDNPLIAPLRFHLVGEILGPDEPRRARCTLSVKETSDPSGFLSCRFNSLNVLVLSE